MLDFSNADAVSQNSSSSKKLQDLSVRQYNSTSIFTKRAKSSHGHASGVGRNIALVSGGGIDIKQFLRHYCQPEQQ
jgi:hypothetical protein